MTEYLVQKVRLGNLVVPVVVTLERGDTILASTIYARDAPTEELAPPVGLVYRFAKLTAASAGEIRDFAANYGVLGSAAAQFFNLPISKTGSLEQWKEPVELWRRAASMTRALGRLAAALRELDPGDDADWRMVLAQETYSEQPELRTIDGSRNIFCRLLDQWCGLARPAERSEWLSGDGPVSRVATERSHSSLLCAVSQELRLAALSRKGLVICSWCKYAYYPPRAIPHGQGVKVCDECAIQAVWRLAKARRREKDRVAGTTSSGAQKGERR